MCVAAPSSRPETSTTTAPTAGFGDARPTPDRARSSALRMWCSSDDTSFILHPVLRPRLHSCPAEADARERCDRHMDLRVRAWGGTAALVAPAVSTSKKAILTVSAALSVLLFVSRCLTPSGESTQTASPQNPLDRTAAGRLLSRPLPHSGPAVPVRAK